MVVVESCGVDMRLLSLEERKAKIRETSRQMDLIDLRGAEFLRLLRLAHSEGLLPELLQAGGCLDHQEVEPHEVLR